MATIGLQKTKYAMRTEGTGTGGTPTVTYSTVKNLAPAISANIDIEHADANLSADDGTLYDMHPFKKGTIQLNVDDLPAAFLTAVLGMRQATNGVIVSAAEDVAVEVALGFMALKADGTYRGVWLPRVKFQIPSDAYNTKGDSITFNTPTLTGTIMEEKDIYADGKLVWRYIKDDTKTNIVTWLGSVPTPSTITYESADILETPDGEDGVDRGGEGE